MATLKEQVEALRDQCGDETSRINCEMILGQMEDPGYLARIKPRLERTAKNQSLPLSLRDTAEKLLEILARDP
jgi:hypothetical protein